jgi:putative MATE family efflux protein
MHIYFGLNNILRASGYPVKAMVITFITVCVNLILALLFIFVFQWGIKGAAWATVIAQFIGLLIVLQHFINSKSYLRFRKGYFKLHWNIVKLIFTMGASPFLMNFCSCFVLIVLNYSLKRYGGDLAIGAYGIINSIGGLCALIIFGFNMGMQPIVGYNFGAKQYNRVLETLKYSLIFGTIISFSVFLIAELFPMTIAGAFTKDSELLRLTKEGIRIAFIMFPFIGGQIVASSFFQAIGMPKISIFLSLSRQLICLIPLLLLLPLWFQLDGVWGASMVADFISATLTAFILIYHYKKIRMKVKEKNLFDNKFTVK